MNKISLTGEWQLRYFCEGVQTVASPKALNDIKVQTVSAQVPGNVELDLLRAGIIPDPFIGTNIRQLRPFEFNDWWYTRTFEMENVEGVWELVFDGLDTLATVWVNDVEVGEAKNMMIAHRFEVTKALRPGSNTICVRLASPMREAQRFDYDASVLSWESRDEGLYVRKAPHMYGWDIMPRAVSAGIFRPVWLEQRAPHAIEHVYYVTKSASPHHANLLVRFQVRTDRFGPEHDIVIRIHGRCGDHVFEMENTVEFTAGHLSIEIANPKLWWPKGYGDANLYDVTMELRVGDEVLAERQDRIGLRTIQVDRTETTGQAFAPGAMWGTITQMDSEPEPNGHFIFRVNGVPIMVKGTNWVPLDAFHSRDAERVDAAMALVDDLGCNMVRCWGGNLYEDHAFFDRCDAYGVMVWQDFAFACNRYPQNDTFLERVREEAESVVEKLRNHASLALWCGNNENDYTYLHDGISRTFDRITREVLPRVVHRCDPHRHYLSSSPYMPEGLVGEPPEQHLWGPRGYYKSPYYAHHNAHFIGEIGYHGCPNVSSIQKFITKENLWPWQKNEEWHIHDVYHWRHTHRDRDRINLMANQIREVFGTIHETLEEFALASQIVQAEAKKYFIESTRLRKWRTSGILWWNVIDGWPQFSDAIVDYYFGKKLAYHYIRRSQQPVCVIIGESAADKYRPVVVCNDTLRDVDVQYRVWDPHLDETLAEGTFRSVANQNWQVARLRVFQSQQRLCLIEWTVDGVRYGNHYFAGFPPHSLDFYRSGMPLIANLPQPFDPNTVAK